MGTSAPHQGEPWPPPGPEAPFPLFSRTSSLGWFRLIAFKLSSFFKFAVHPQQRWTLHCSTAPLLPLVATPFSADVIPASEKLRQRLKAHKHELPAPPASLCPKLIFKRNKVAKSIREAKTAPRQGLK